MKFGRNKGDDFYNQGCNDNTNEITFANEFYLPKNILEIPLEFEPSCSSGRLSKTVHKVYPYESDEMPTIYEFLSNGIGGAKSTKYCPISEFINNQDYIYKGLCSEQETSEDIDLETKLGESFTSESFCVLSSLIRKDIENSENASKLRAVCYEMHCSSLSLTIKVKDHYIVCPRSGGKIISDLFHGYILCPDYYLICAGTSVCNSIINCINKTSEEKPYSVSNYDYEIKTTQNSDIYKRDDYIVTNEDKPWELAEDNTQLCPSFCMECYPNKKCYKCAPHFKKEDDGTCSQIVPFCEKYTDDEHDECIKCINGYFLVQDIIDTPYYCIEDNDENKKHYYEYSTEPNPNYFKRCDNEGISNCDECNTNNICINCKTDNEKIDGGEICDELSDLYYSDNGDYKSCSKYTEKQNCNRCRINSGNFECIQCLNTYAFFDDASDKNECILISSKGTSKYYSLDNIMYYPCSHSISYCDICNNNTEICTSCITGYNVVNDNTLCIKFSEKKYYKDSNNYYYLCSVSLSNCITCENKNQCLTCDTGYELEDTDLCIDHDLAVSSEYYLNNDNKYTKCSKTIPNCKTCSLGTECYSCVDGYNFVKGDDNQIACQNIDINYYYQITEGTKTYYKKCDKAISNCDKCSSENYCTKCKNNFGIIENDHSKCEDISTGKYYKDIDSGLYKLCSTGLNKCEICTIEDGNKFICNQCFENYALVHDNEITCIEKSNIEGNNEYYSIDSGINYYSCSNSLYNNILNCKKCSNKETCSECKPNFIINNNIECLSIDDIEDHLYFYNPNLKIYELCSNLIDLCHKCSSNSTCTECSNEGALEESNICISKELVNNNNYFLDEETNKYVSCSIINNCITCNSNTTCLSCKDGYILNNHICKKREQKNDDKDNKLSTGAIVGIIFGCLGFLLIVAGVIIFILYKLKKNKFGNNNPSLVKNEKVDEKDIVGKVNLEKPDEIQIQSSKRGIHNA